MCEYSGRLIAWLDRELPDQAADNVARHVGQCAECRRAASAYEEIGAAFLACYEAETLRRAPPNVSGTGPRRTPFCTSFLGAATIARPKRGGWRWAMAGGLAAAAVLAAVFLNPRPHHEQRPAPRPAESVMANAFGKSVPKAAPNAVPNSVPGAAAVRPRRRPVGPPLPRYTRKTVRDAGQFLTDSEVRAAPFALPTEWVPAEPTVEIALPADALFPPGAVPPGFSFIADVRPQP